MGSTGLNYCSRVISFSNREYEIHDADSELLMYVQLRERNQDGNNCDLDVSLPNVPFAGQIDGSCQYYNWAEFSHGLISIDQHNINSPLGHTFEVILSPGGWLAQMQVSMKVSIRVDYIPLE